MLTTVLRELLAAIAPPVCVACRGPAAAAGEPLCPGCRRDLPWLEGDRCERCALPAPCRPCPARGAPWEAAWAPLAYEGSARALVAALKFRGALPVADLMAAPLAAGAPRGLLEGATLVPVPLHPARRRSRGFNQAERLARALGRRRGLPVAECLRRRGQATRQAGAGRSARLSASRIAVFVRPSVPARVVLVDDVHTTGATFRACAEALRSAGCERVACVSYARTLSG